MRNAHFTYFEIATIELLVILFRPLIWLFLGDSLRRAAAAIECNWFVDLCRYPTMACHAMPLHRVALLPQLLQCNWFHFSFWPNRFGMRDRSYLRHRSIRCCRQGRRDRI